MSDEIVLDPEDQHLLQAYTWSLTRRKNTTYARRLTPRPEQRAVYLHHAVLGVPSSVHIDHENGNGLDNRKTNLRVASRSQNLANCRSHSDSRSRFKGVSWHRRARKWVAQIYRDGRQIHLGLFIDEEGAARAYDAAALDKSGSFARLNFPKGEL